MRYRLILFLPAGTYGITEPKWGSSANYPTCTRATPDGCQGKLFDTLQEAISYSLAAGETPVLVESEDESWAIVEGATPAPSKILGTPTTLPPTPPPAPAPTPAPPPPPDPSEDAPVPTTLMYPFGTTAAVTVGIPGVGPIIAIASIIGTIFGFFGGGINKATRRALDGLAGAIANVAWIGYTFAHWIARALGKVLSLLKDLWEKVIAPALKHLELLTSKLARLIDRILGPYLELIRRIRETVLQYYLRFVRPVIEILQKIRKALAILKVLRVPGVKKLDDKLRRIEAKIMAPLQAVLERLNEHSGFINILMNARRLLQRPLLGASMHSYAYDWISLWWNEQLPDERRPIRPVPDAVRLDTLASEAEGGLREYARRETGALAPLIDRGLAVFHATARRK